MSVVLKSILLVAGLLLLCAAGCDNSSPTSIDTTPGPQSADAAVEEFSNALAAMDSVAMQELLADDFLFHAGSNLEVMGTPLLDRDRFMLSLLRMFGEESPLDTCSFDSVGVVFWSDDEWVATPDTVNFPNTLYRQYRVTIEFTSSLCSSFEVYGSLNFYTKISAINSNAGSYEIVGIADHTWANKTTAVASDAFSQVIAEYLYEGLPHAVLVADSFRGTNLNTFELDASGSWCDGDGLSGQPIRWSVNGEEFSPDWTAARRGLFQFPLPGKYFVTLEVRNTVGWTSQATATFEVFAAYPADLDQLLDTFAFAHNARDVGVLYQCLAPEFRFNVLPQDIEEYELESDHFDLASYISASLSLFRDTFEFGKPPPVIEFDFWFGEPNLGAESTVPTYITARRLDAETLYAGGFVSFVARPTAVVFSDGKVADVWRFEEISDKTAVSEFGAGNISWGGLLATYK